MKHERIQSRPLSSAVRRSPPVTQIPIGWMGGDVWRLPSGKALSEFALQAGFLAPLLLKVQTTQAVTRAVMMTPEIRDAV